jgi:hypothetical protein
VSAYSKRDAMNEMVETMEIEVRNCDFVAQVTVSYWPSERDEFGRFNRAFKVDYIEVLDIEGEFTQEMRELVQKEASEAVYNLI